MGSYLAVPVTTKLLERHSSEGRGSAPSFRVGVASMNGWRSQMEDAHVVSVKENCALFGVFDGHGGNECSQFLSMRLAEEIRDGVIDDNEVQNIALRLDGEFLQIPTSQTSGSTGTFVIATQKDSQSFELQVANVGDSRVVLARVDGAGIAETVTLTTDHRPSDALEFKRIVAADGHVSNDRVNGDLALSRAFGDGRFKKGGIDNRSHQVTALPDVTHAACKKGDILVACCDGAFEADCFTERTLMEFVHRKLQDSDDLASVAAAVCDQAVEKGSKDNVTCVVIMLGESQGNVVTKAIAPGPISRPHSSSFMSAYTAAAEAAGVQLSECVEQRYTEVAARLRHCRLQSELAQLTDELAALPLPDDLAALPPAHSSRVSWFAQWLDDLQLYDSDSESDYVQQSRIEFEHCKGNKMDCDRKDGEGAWWSVLEVLEAEMDLEDEEPNETPATFSSGIFSSYSSKPSSVTHTEADDQCTEGSHADNTGSPASNHKLGPQSTPELLSFGVQNDDVHCAPLCATVDPPEATFDNDFSDDEDMLNHCVIASSLLPVSVSP